MRPKRKFKNVLYLFLLSTLTFGSTNLRAGDTIDHANVFIQSFGQTCQGFGSYTQSALELTDEFMGILRTLKDDPNCSAIYQSLDTVKLLSENLQFLHSDPKGWAKQERKNKFIGEVLSGLDVSAIIKGVTSNDLIANYPFTNVSQTFGKAYLNSQTAKFAAKDEELQRRKEIDDMLAHYIQNLRRAVSASHQCIVGHPNIPVAVIGHSMALAGAYAGDKYGAAMVLIGTLMNELNEFVRQLPFDKALKKGIEGKFYNAISCGAEAMVENYCEAHEAREFLEIRLDTLEGKRNQNSDIWQGLEILSRSYPKLRSWFVQIKDGTSAINREIAIKIMQVEQKHAKRKVVGHYITGEFGYFQERFATASTPEAKRSVVQQFVTHIGDLAFKGGASGDEANPYEEYFPHLGKCNYERSIYLGLGKVPPIPSGSSCETELNNDSSQAFDLMVVKKNVDDIQSAIKSVVDLEKSKVIGQGADPERVWLEGSRMDTLGRQNLATLKRFSAYLDFLSRRWDRIIQSNPGRDMSYLKFQREHADSFKAAIDDLVKLILAPRGQGPNGQPMTFIEKLDTVERTLKLGPETDFVLLNVVTFIDVDLNERMLNGEIDVVIADLIRLAAEDFYKQYSRGSKETAGEIYEDLANALSISQETIDTYVGFLGSHIVKGVKHFLHQSKQAGEVIDPTDPNPLKSMRYFNAAKLCVLALAAGDSVRESKLYEDPVWRTLSPSLKKVCSGMELYSPVYRATKLKIEFDKLYDQPWSKRICAVHRMNEQARVYELNALVQSELNQSASAWKSSKNDVPPFLDPWKGIINL